MAKSRIPKRIYTSIWILAVLVISILGATTFISWNVSRLAEHSAKYDAGNKLEELAFQMSDKADRGIDERYHNVLLFVNSVSLKTPGSSVSAKQQLTNAIGKAYPQYAFIAVTDLAGKVIASKDGLLLGKSVAARPWFKNSLIAQPDTLIVEDVHEAVLLAALLPQNANGEPLRFIDIAGPIYDFNNSLVGVAGVHLSFNWIDDIRRNLIKPHEDRDNVEVFILDNTNRLLLGPTGQVVGTQINVDAAKRAFKGESGWTQEYWPDGREYVTGYFGSVGSGEFKGLGWKILVRQPSAEAFMAANTQSRQILLSGLILGTLMTLAAAAVIWRVLKHEQDVEEAQRSFVSIASHQLRTPLAAIGWYSEILLDDEQKLGAKRSGYLRQISQSNRRMVELVNSLLDTSRLDSGKMANNPTPIALSDIVASIKREIEPQIKDQQQIFEEKIASDLPKLFIDGKSAHMVIQNLLSNAVKYTPKKGSIKIRANRSPRRGKLRITISDTGYGIPQSDQRKIFSKMYRAGNVTKMDVEGTGLGLYIVKQVVERSGGKIWFESVEGTGTTFYVDLPVVTEQ